MRKPVLGVACLLLVISVALTGVLYQTGDVPTDETVTSVEIDEDGDAVFELKLRTRLNTDERREAFELFADEVEQDPDSFLSSFRDSVVPIVDSAGNRTGRDMEASNFSIETAAEPLPVERGVVRYEFEWSGFAEVDGGGDGGESTTIRAGDALSAYILSGDDSLRFLYPDGYVVDSVDPEPDINGTGEIGWDGPRDLSDDQPRLTVVERRDNTVEADDSPEEDGGSEETEDSPSPPLYAYVLVLLVLLSVGAVVYHRQRPEKSEPVEEDRTPDEEPVKEILENVPDEERILRIVEREGGRMKQKKVVEETGWSEAKVSQVTSRLEDEGKIGKLRMGRENILEVQGEGEADEKDGSDEPNI